MPQFEVLKVKAELISDLLGSQPASEELFQKYVKEKLRKEIEKLEKQALKTKDEALMEKVAILEAELGEEAQLPIPEEDKGLTVFPRSYKDGYLCLLNHQIEGFLKEVVGNYFQKGLKQEITRYVRVEPREIVLYEDKEMTEPLREPDRILERPLRAYTPQGYITSIVRSELIKPPAYFSFVVKLVESPKRTIKLKDIKEMLSYGEEVLGLLQWRSGGYGRFRVLEAVED